MNNQYCLLRHGETIYQTKKKGFTYPKPNNKIRVRLTEKSKKELKKLAKKIKKEKIDLIYSSDIFRAVQTVEIVAKELKLNVNFDKRLRDVNLGIYHGETKAEFYKDFPDPKKRFTQKPKGGESWNDVKKRMLNLLKEIDKKYKNKTILIVSHGDPLWLLEGVIKKMTNQELLDEIFVKKNYIKVGEFRKLCPVEKFRTPSGEN